MMLPRSVFSTLTSSHLTFLISHLSYFFSHVILVELGKLLSREYIKCVHLPLIEVVGPIMNLISRIHNFCGRREYAFNVLPEYLIIIRRIVGEYYFYKGTV